MYSKRDSKRTSHTQTQTQFLPKQTKKTHTHTGPAWVQRGSRCRLQSPAAGKMSDEAIEAICICGTSAACGVARVRVRRQESVRVPLREVGRGVLAHQHLKRCGDSAHLLVSSQWWVHGRRQVHLHDDRWRVIVEVSRLSAAGSVLREAEVQGRVRSV